MQYSRKFICNDLPSAQELREWKREEMLKQMLRDMEEISDYDDDECDSMEQTFKLRNILK